MTNAIDSYLGAALFAPHYPEVAGSKATGTSAQAAESVDAATLRESARWYLRHYGPMTADECANRMGESVLSIRPRFSELAAKAQIIDTGERRENASGRRAVVWRSVE